MELKNESEDEKECLRQAANASHASLLLCERLAAPANIDPSPIVAFTSVGPRAKVFIAYKSEEEDEEQVYVRPVPFPGKYYPKSSIEPAKKSLI